MLGAATRFFSSLFQAEVNIVSNLERITDAFNRTKESIEREVATLKAFKFEPKWKSRVINVPIAIKQIKKLIEKTADEFKNKFEVLKAPIHELTLIFKVEAQPSADADKPAALTRAAVKVDELATMISQLATAMEQIESWAEFFEGLTKDIEELDKLFLPQGKPKKTVTVTYKKRTG